MVSAPSASRWALVAALLTLLPAAAADNCSGPADCEATADYNNGIAVGGGIVAIIISIIVSTFGPPGTGAVLGPGTRGPYTGDELTVNDGRWPDVPKGHKWWPWDGGGWRSPEDIDRLIRERNEQIAKQQEDIRKEKEWIAKEDARNDKTWEDNKKWSEEGTKDLGRRREAEAQKERDVKAAEEQAERDRKRLEDLREQQEKNFKEQEKAGSWETVKEEFWDKTTKEIDELPGDLQKLGRDLVRGGFKAAETAARELTTWENWRVGIETVGGTAWDAMTGPGKLLAGDKKTWDNVVNTMDTVGKVGGHIVNEIKKDPVEFVKGLTPIKAWEEAMDPNKPLIERIGRTWWATVETVLTVEGIGKAIGKGGAKAVGEVGDEAIEAARRALKEKKLPPKVSPAELKELNKEWEKTRAIAKGKVTEYDRATRHVDDAIKAGDDAAIELAKQKQRDAAIKLQGDKVSLQEINRRKPETITKFKDDMKEIYGKTDDKMVDWAAKQKGYGPMKPAGTTDDGARIFKDAKGNEVHIAEPTNPTKPGAKPKAGADRDYTMRSKDAPEPWVKGGPQPNQAPPLAKDIPADKVQKAYDDHFFEAAGGPDMAKRTGLPEDPSKFTHKMDQLGTDGMHPEAYGKTQSDLDAAIKRPGQGFSDSDQIGKAMGFKGDHWVNQGGQTNVFEGTRQTMKQFDNQAMGRFNAMDKHVGNLQEAGLLDKGFAVKPPSPQITEGVEILRKVHQPNGISPAQAVEDLRKIGLTPEDLNRGVGDYVDGLQRTAPKVLRHQMGLP